MKKTTIILSLLTTTVLAVSAAQAGPVIDTIQTHASLWINNINSTEIPEPTQFLIALAGIVGLKVVRKRAAINR